jgi:murein DD-endopeptidase MepM/ murein hydrolase activator NlpD
VAESTRTTAPFWYRVSARTRGLALTGGVIAIALSVLGGLLLPESWLPDALELALAVGGPAALVLGIVLSFVPFAARLPERRLAAPVRGRWRALNSPATRVPSHVTHAYGQTFAVDVVYEPEDGARPEFGHGAAFRPPTDYPGFGREVMAPADGRVVGIRDGARDHRSRSSWAAFAFMLAEGAIRELAGPRGLLGNYVILDLGDGEYGAIAHLQRGSVRVAPGQSVRAGEAVGRCGNSGNSSEPHVHLQLMDHPTPLLAAGLPFAFEGIRIDGRAPEVAMPANEETFVADGQA